MGYKKSEYNIEIASLENGETLIHNTYTCALGLMDKNVKSLYDNIENLDTTQEKYQEDSEVEMLKKNGFIVDSERDELKEIILETRNYRYHTSKSILSLVVAPTFNCNMKCRYCYEDKKNISIDNETKSLLIDFIRSKINSIKILHMLWYGGEPLLKLPVIEELSEEIISICNEYKVRYEAEIITNGVLMTKNAAMILKEKCHIKSAQVTIDGTRAINNERRPLVSSEDGFSIIINNIKEASNYLNIKIRVNVDRKNQDSIGELMDFLEEETPKNVNYYFSPVRKVGCNAKDDYCLETKDFLDFVSKTLKTGALKYNSTTFKTWYPRRKLAPCNAVGQNSFTIDPRGKIYKCIKEIGQEELSIGDLREGISKNKRYVAWLTADVEDKCLACKLLPVCQGGCHKMKLDNIKEECDGCIDSYKDKLFEIYIMQKF